VLRAGRQQWRRRAADSIGQRRPRVERCPPSRVDPVSPAPRWSGCHGAVRHGMPAPCAQARAEKPPEPDATGSFEFRGRRPDRPSGQRMGLCSDHPVGPGRTRALSLLSPRVPAQAGVATLAQSAAPATLVGRGGRRIPSDALSRVTQANHRPACPRLESPWLCLPAQFSKRALSPRLMRWESCQCMRSGGWTAAFRAKS
jgi:hypothetical protein